MSSAQLSRKQINLRRQRQARTNRIIIIAGILGVTLLLIGFVVLTNLKPNAPVATTDILPGDSTTVPYSFGKILGMATAPIAIVEFGDFQCPYCNLFHQTIQPQIVEQFVSTGMVRFEFHHYIVVDGNVGGNESRRAAEASECANEQDKFWNFHSAVYANQNGEGEGAFADSRLTAIAQSVGLDMDQFNACFSSGKYREAVRADEQLAASLGVRSTPAVFVNGMRVENPIDFSEIASVVNVAIAQLP
jgi:protein-disulfide isomerase